MRRGDGWLSRGREGRKKGARWGGRGEGSRERVREGERKVGRE